MKNTLKQLILRFQERGLPNDLRPRAKDLTPFLQTNNAVVITGPRRAGKTYLLFQFMQGAGCSRKQIVYINFEDNVLVDFTHKNFQDLMNAYQELYPGETPFFFLDEIHEVPQWERFVRTLVDNRYRVFVTGSNARLLSKEYATLLGGRYLELELYPLSFREFLSFKDVNGLENILYSERRFEILALFEEYLNYGGFPEVVLTQDIRLKEKIIDAYFKTAFFKDIIERFRIRDEALFEVILKKTSENLGKPFSFRSVANKVKQLGHSASTKTIVHYLQCAIHGYLLRASFLKRESVLRRESERKFYFIDNGYLNTFFVSPNFGKKLENVIAVALTIQGKKLFYYRNQTEIDFILEDGMPLQVCQDISHQETLQRELKSLKKYLTQTGLGEGLILSWNETDTVTIENKTIRIIPAWYFLLTHI